MRAGLTKQRTLLIDADIVAFKFAAKAPRTFGFGTAVDDLADVTPKVDQWLMDLKDQLKATDLIICLSCPTAENFRLKFLPTYKGNRDYSKRPEHLSAIKDHMETSYPSYRKPELEADDIMGILSTHPTLVPGQKIIVSEDKDMKTIPGWLFNPAKDGKPWFMDQIGADYWHLYQTLCGDATDYYAGCPGIGDKKAQKALTGPDGPIEFSEMWSAVVVLFASKGLSEEDALVQARVARILRYTDYQFQEKRVIPWTPTASPHPQSPTRSTASTASTTPS